MDFIGKQVWAAMILWAVATAVGLLIALAPLLLAVVGFALTVAVIGFVARLVAGWLFY